MFQEKNLSQKPHSIRPGDYFLILAFVVTFFVFPILFIWNALEDIHTHHSFLSETQLQVGKLIQVFKVQSA